MQVTPLYWRNIQNLWKRSLSVYTKNELSNIRNISPSIQLCTSSRGLQKRSTLNVPLMYSSEFSVLMNGTQVRCYAKGKDKKGKDRKSKSHISDEEMNEMIDVEQMHEDMANAVTQLKQDYIKHLSLRSSAGAIESIMVELEGDEYPLQEVAQVSRKSPKMLIISAVAFPQAAPSIVKAIQDSGMNLNPQQEGTTIYVPLPKITREHREGLARNAKTMFQKCKDRLRDVSNKYIKKSKNHTELSEDLVFQAQLKIRELADEHVAEAEKLMNAKQKELLNPN
ncbi:mitochondrial ribosome recycling factor 1 isoform X2 [Oratosquilla oratoria]|uniref:mitochondrial ribosome recycling factor 1 isoform X2 n=1 Tax=Oratosquilla oratoria TaxID=337810 RepID=UPI003F762F1E